MKRIRFVKHTGIWFVAARKFLDNSKFIKFINFNASIGAVKTHLKMLFDILGFWDKVVKVDATRENRSFSCKYWYLLIYSEKISRVKLVRSEDNEKNHNYTVWCNYLKLLFKCSQCDKCFSLNTIDVWRKLEKCLRRHHIHLLIGQENDQLWTLANDKAGKTNSNWGWKYACKHT